ncbi:MAG: tetratricopeptide repeat protein, partial [Deltaproteobacteria bacterium]|nr:tetratricopeptide repeat protein [Deltaproteobacteria bacterium]
MIYAHTINRYLVAALVFLLLVLVMPAEIQAGEYGYDETDQSSRQAKYLAKLQEDRKKVDLAIRNTKALIDTSRNKPYLPELYLREAELYVELSRIAFFLRKGESTGSSSAFGQLESNTLKNQAIEIYQRILDNFPEFDARDKIHFFLAHEYRELGKIDEMVKQYRVIISEYKNSPYVPEAYLLLGDYFINLQDLDMAIRHYTAVLGHPESPAIAIARYKLAWCHINNAEFKKAIRLFEEAVKSTQAGRELDVDTYKRVDIRTEA